MNWNNLFNESRFEYPSKGKSDRTNFERDFDRIVFSSAFRRLQDKTQVIPLPENDFVHTRLTHSLETSSVGKSLGSMVGKVITDRYQLEYNERDFAAIVGAAALAHDIGNPPFGHSGETAISDYFKHGNGQVFESKMTKDEWSDLINFEGNANGFKLLTNYNQTMVGGVSLSFTTLAAFSKYPTKSLKEESDIPLLKNRVSQKKYGYFQSEKSQIKEVFDAQGIMSLTDYAYVRHPLAYLVEAADDICYRIIDFEDGIRIGLVNYNEGEEILLALIENDLNIAKYNGIRGKIEKISYLRSKAINVLVNKMRDVFLDNESNILNGSFDSALMDSMGGNPLLDEIENISRSQIYESESVIQIEAAGFVVVGELLEIFITSLNDWWEAKTLKQLRKSKPLSYKLIQLLPETFRLSNAPEERVYDRIMQICEYISSLTDRHAVSLYKKLKGIELAK